MITRDGTGLIVDPSNYDGGDSARGDGIFNLFSPESNLKNSPLNYCLSIHSGILFRHPYQDPWKNPKNFSKDQLICFLAGAWKWNTTLSNDLLRKVFWRHARRFFFCQNFERDYPGTTKYPWPHTFTDDHGIVQHRKFDFADPLFPHHIAHLILCARIKWLYPLVPLGWPFLFLSCVFNSRKLDIEQNQLQCMVKVAGKFWVWFYKTCDPNWKIQTWTYWSNRVQTDMADLIMGNL